MQSKVQPLASFVRKSHKITCVICYVPATGIASHNRVAYIMCMMQWGSGEAITSTGILIPGLNCHKSEQTSSWLLSYLLCQCGVNRLISIRAALLLLWWWGETRSSPKELKTNLLLPL